MANAGGIGRNHTFASNEGIGFQGTEKGNAAITIVDLSSRQYNITKLTTII